MRTATQYHDARNHSGRRVGRFVSQFIDANLDANADGQLPRLFGPKSMRWVIRTSVLSESVTKRTTARWTSSHRKGCQTCGHVTTETLCAPRGLVNVIIGNFGDVSASNFDVAYLQATHNLDESYIRNG